jgi:hypothetical protein
MVHSLTSRNRIRKHGAHDTHCPYARRNIKSEIELRVLSQLLKHAPGNGDAVDKGRGILLVIVHKEPVNQLALVADMDSKGRKEGQGVVCSEDVSPRIILRVKAGIVKFPSARSNDARGLVGKAAGIIYMLGVVLEIR